MKKYFCYFFCVTLLLFFTACKKSFFTENKEQSPEWRALVLEEESDPLSIGQKITILQAKLVACKDETSRESTSLCSKKEIKKTKDDLQLLYAVVKKAFEAEM